MRLDNEMMTTYECDNCGWHGNEINPDIQDYDQRVDVAVEPEGECPECGALAYDAEELRRASRTFALRQQFDAAMIWLQKCLEGDPKTGVHQAATDVLDLWEVLRRETK